jgi:hypothetical protein
MPPQLVSTAGAAGTYGHHHPDFLHGAANAVTSKHRVSVVESLVDLRCQGKTAKSQMIMVGVARFEPATPAAITIRIFSKRPPSALAIATREYAPNSISY